MLGNIRYRRRGMSSDMREPRTEYRVGEQAHATELEEHRGVSDEGDAVRGSDHRAAVVERLLEGLLLLV